MGSSILFPKINIFSNLGNGEYEASGVLSVGNMYSYMPNKNCLISFT